jgi:predicted dehydrogenase
MEPVRVGFFGVGMMAQACHIQAFQRATGCEVAALASARPQLLAAVADRFAVPTRYASHLDLAADPDIDLVAVIAPPEVNVAVCCDLLAAGKHVFCEKPVGVSVDDALRLQEAATAADRHLLVGFMKRFDAGVQAARQVARGWLQTGEAGKLLMARAHSFIGGDWTANIEGLFPILKTDEPVAPRPLTSPPDWLPAHLGGLWNPFYFFNHVHSHDMDLLNYFLGPDFTVVHADWSRDAHIALLDYAGVLATLTVGGPMANNRWDEELRLYFEHGWVHVQLPPPMLINVPAEVTVYRMGERQEVADVRAPYSWSFLRQAQNAVDVVAGSAEPLCTIADGLAQVRMTEAIFRQVCGCA